jgi:hypothetical protein
MSRRVRYAIGSLLVAALGVALVTAPVAAQSVI